MLAVSQCPFDPRCSLLNDAEKVIDEMFDTILTVTSRTSLGDQLDGPQVNRREKLALDCVVDDHQPRRVQTKAASLAHKCVDKWLLSCRPGHVRRQGKLNCVGNNDLLVRRLCGVSHEQVIFIRT